jgi:hypothetical protein
MKSGVLHVLEQLPGMVDSIDATEILLRNQLKELT